MELKFHTNLSKDECIKRLNDAFRQKFFSVGKPIVGKVNGGKFHFREPEGWGTWSFNKRFSGHIESVSDGTEIIGTLSAMTVMNCIFVVVIVFGLLVVSNSMKNTPSLLTLWGIAIIIGFLYYLFRDRDGQYINFIKKVFDANQIN